MQLANEEGEFIEPYLPIGEYGRIPSGWEFGAWSTVRNRFRQGRDVGVFDALLEGLITEAAKRREIGPSPVGIDSTTPRAHNAAGIHPGNIEEQFAPSRAEP